ncbi:MAG: leucine-rich repeat domain-containing protein [Bacteroidaceae bacterium]|nr:leucine-rich repeat domain-containing protein [Bacteroidaceae bacterium]
MNRTKTRLALLVASICLCTSVWAERVAPTLPDFTTLESGKTYYLYNVGTGKFLTRSTVSNTYPGVGTYGAAVTVAQASNGSYTLRFADGITTYYLYAETSTTSSRSSVYNNCYFAIKDSLGGYVIQRSTANTSYYVENEYVGYADGAANDRIVPNLTEGNIVWQLMETTVAERYFAEHKLYTALEAMNPYNYTIDQYETIYANPESTTEELTTAATTLTNALSLTTAYDFPETSDFPILLEYSNNGSWATYKSTSTQAAYLSNSGIQYKDSVNLIATVTVDQHATLDFGAECNSSSGVMRLFVDNEHILDIASLNEFSSIQRHFIELEAGTHTIEWRFVNQSAKSYISGSIYSIGIEATPIFEVNLLEPGSLGTEVLYNVDHVKDVRRLKVIGEMNDDDWAKLDMMVNLYDLDLSEAKITAIPDNQFYRGYGDNPKCNYLHKISLPEGLISIGKYAFYQSYIKKMNFPSTLKTIETHAFSNSMLTEAMLPAGMEDIGNSAFGHCYSLREVDYPDSMTYIPEHCFWMCYNLNTFVLHEGLETIDSYAFENSANAPGKFNPRLPSTLTTIGRDAFSSCGTDSLFVPEALTTWIYGGGGLSYAFYNNDNLVYAEFPTTFYKVSLANIITGCNKLNTLVLKSPTLVDGSYKDGFLNGSVVENITIKVPSFLVNAYKLDEYWYNYKIEGFNTSDIKDWTIRGELVLNNRERIEGTPNVTVARTGSIKINGENAQAIDTLVTFMDRVDGYYGRILVNNDATTIAGEYIHNYRIKEKTWYFISLPFDFTVGEVTNDANAKLAIRYYDGASRAVDGAKGNWKNYAAEDVIKAGTGFIVQASAATTLTFRAMDNESKQNAVSNEEFVKALAANPSETVSNSGWNLVGNPWQTYFNIHTLNFTAPITVYNVSAKTYTAYSIIDDDYAIRPNEAFFVQCPEGTEYISFPETGRQLTSEITNQSSAPAKRTAVMGSRQLVDVAISTGDLTDKTRVVLNEAALMEYETACDASKFFTMDAGVPQIYTLDSEATEYAINERPVGNGNVQLGVVIAASGKHTISMPRNDAQTVVLIDHVAGTTHDLSLGEYTFTADAGTYNGRFTLSISKAPTTAIDEATATDFTVKSVENAIVVSGAEGMVTVFAVDGRKVAEQESKGSVTFGNLPEGSYLVRTVNGTSKVTVK